MITTVRRLNRTHIASLMAERDSERRATHDSLTGMLNRDGLLSALSQELHRAKDLSEAFTLFYMDLDGFKGVNDSFGHAAGDELLRQAASRFAAAIPVTCLLGRLGGDEFVVLAPRCDATTAAEIGEAVVKAIGRVFAIKPGVDVSIGVSVGIACATPDSTVDALLTEADAALYRAKTSGKGRYVLNANSDASDRRAA